MPAALDGVIHKGNAGRVSAKTVLELANGPIAYEAEAELLDRGVMVVPDILANAGGVTVSYFEWVQNKMGWYWEKSEVFARLKQKMDEAFEAVDLRFEARKQDKNWSMRLAAYELAVARVVEAMRMRGVPRTKA